MSGWMLQMYAYAPAWANVVVNDFPLSKRSLDFTDASVKTTLWATSLVLVHVTAPPVATFTESGTNFHDAPAGTIWTTVPAFVPAPGTVLGVDVVPLLPPPRAARRRPSRA